MKALIDWRYDLDHASALKKLQEGIDAGEELALLHAGRSRALVHDGRLRRRDGERAAASRRLLEAAVAAAHAGVLLVDDQDEVGTPRLKCGGPMAQEQGRS